MPVSAVSAATGGGNLVLGWVRSASGEGFGVECGDGFGIGCGVEFGVGFDDGKFVGIAAPVV